MDRFVKKGAVAALDQHGQLAKLAVDETGRGVFEDKAGADESVKFAHKGIEETAPNLSPNPPRVTEGYVVATNTK